MLAQLHLTPTHDKGDELPVPHRGLLLTMQTIFFITTGRNFNKLKICYQHHHYRTWLAPTCTSRPESSSWNTHDSGSILNDCELYTIPSSICKQTTACAFGMYQI